MVCCMQLHVYCNLFYTIEAKFNYMCHMQLKIIVAKSKFACHDIIFCENNTLLVWYFWIL